MKINILSLTSCDIKINSIRLPLPSEACVITDNAFHQKGPWWYTSAADDGKEYIFVADGNVHYPMSKLQTAGVRPVVTFDDENNSSYVGCEFMFGNYLFKVFEPGIAVCETMVAYSPFSNVKNIHSDYKNSLIMPILANWLYYVAMLPDGIQKVINKIPVEEKFFNPGLLKEEEVTVSSFLKLKSSQPYWKYGRKDEFTGKCIDINGKTRYAALTDKTINVQPVIYFNSEKTPLKYAQFEIGGFVFQQAGCENFALCKNTIGTSCYSTGIVTMTECSEEEFYKDSEIKKVIDEWFKKL